MHQLRELKRPIQRDEEIDLQRRVFFMPADFASQHSDVRTCGATETILVQSLSETRAIEP
jgi:hypothetical protein